MHQHIRRATMFVVVVLLVAATSLLTSPSAAHAETKRVPCGAEVTAKPGDRIVASLHEGAGELLTFDLGRVRQSTTSLIGTGADLLGSVLGLVSDLFCKVTVNVADAVEQVPGVGRTAGNAIKDGAESLNETAHETTNTVTERLSPGESSEEPSSPRPETGGEQQASSNESPAGGQSADSITERTGGEQSPAIAAPASPAAGRGTPLQPVLLPSEFSSGAAPMRDYSGIPYALPGEFTPAPGVRHGKSIEGYTPEFDLLGPPDEKNGPRTQHTSPGKPAAADRTATDAGDAEAVPVLAGQTRNPASVPVMLAVMALAASTAGLVRTWVVRRS